MALHEHPDLIVTNVRPWGGSSVDISISNNVITELTPHRPPENRSQELEPYLIDGHGMLALPGLINSHAHIDKSWWGLPWVPYGGESTTQGRISHERTHRDDLAIPSIDVTRTVVKELIRHGTTAIRTHVDVDLGLGLRGIHIVREAVESFGGAIEVKIVAFPQDGLIRRPGVAQLLDQAAAEGADAIGGLDPASIDRDPVAQIDLLFRMAERRGVGIDIHLHDGGELGAFQIELIIDRTLRTGLQGKVNIAHAFAVGQLPSNRQKDLISAMGAAQISLTTVAPVSAAPLPWGLISRYGVQLGIGTDGIRDLWGPYGDGDLLAIATRFAQLHNVRHDEDLLRVVRLATSEGAHFIGRECHDIVPGALADIVLLDAENVPDALVRAPARQVVIAGGKVLVNGGRLLL